MAISTVFSKCSLLALSLAPIACTFPVKAGDNPDDSDDDGASEEPTGEPRVPGVCGDGVVNTGEACDDGDGDDDDGCDAACARTPALEWIYRTDTPWTANAVAVGPAGRIVFVGDGEVRALGPGGEELWLRVMPEDSHAFNAVEIDEHGTIYVSGEVGTMHALDPDGDELWRSDVGLNFRTMALGHGALYTVDSDRSGPLSRFIVRRHDRDTGAVVWASELPDDIAMNIHRMTVAGPHVVVVGRGNPGPDEPSQPLVGAFDELGALATLEFGDEPGLIWQGVAATPDGGVGLVGHNSSQLVVGRLATDLSPKWTLGPEAGAAWVIAGASTGALAVVGSDGADSFVRRLDNHGAIVWADSFSPGEGGHTDVARAVEFGPGFLVAVGGEGTVNGTWVRKYTD